VKLAVRDFAAPARWGELDTETGAVSPLEKPAGDEKEQGYFMRLGDSEVSFCAVSGKLMLLTTDAQVALTGSRVEVAGEDLRTLRVEREGELLMRVAYPNPVNPPMELDFTMAEEEDFDLGLFVKNVLASEKRKTIMLKKWS
jgi:hypothetical protein